MTVRRAAVVVVLVAATWLLTAYWFFAGAMIASSLWILAVGWRWGDQPDMRRDDFRIVQARRRHLRALRRITRQDD